MRMLLGFWLWVVILSSVMGEGAENEWDYHDLIITQINAYFLYPDKYIYVFMFMKYYSYDIKQQTPTLLKSFYLIHQFGERLVEPDCYDIDLDICFFFSFFTIMGWEWFDLLKC